MQVNVIINPLKQLQRWNVKIFWEDMHMDIWYLYIRKTAKSLDPVRIQGILQVKCEAITLHKSTVYRTNDGAFVYDGLTSSQFGAVDKPLFQSFYCLKSAYLQRFSKTHFSKNVLCQQLQFGTKSFSKIIFIINSNWTYNFISPVRIA